MYLMEEEYGTIMRPVQLTIISAEPPEEASPTVAQMYHLPFRALHVS
jgi:hypothetical protein